MRQGVAGGALFRGRGVAKDEARAKRLGAEALDALGAGRGGGAHLVALGILFDEGVAKDLERAVEW